MAETSQPGKRKKILVVDDDAAMLHLLTMILLRRGYEVATAASAERALALLVSSVPDLIISDIQMPEMSGWEFFQKARLRPETSGVPFIFLTNVASPPDRVRGLRMGADDFIAKPFHHDELLARLEKCLEHHRGRASLLSPSHDGVAGTLGHLSLIDIIQVLEMNRRSALISVQRSGNAGKIYVKDGIIQGISVDGVFDPRLFYQMLLWEGAAFRIETYVDDVPPASVVALPAGELIMESVRMLDERHK
ncbi:MAG: response regulator [Acidobacteriota bacterium]